MINPRISECLPSHITEALPYRVSDEVRAGGYSNIEEIRLRRERCASLTVGGENIFLDTVLSGDEIDETLKKLCGGSLYAYAETIRSGYLSLPGGIRAGVCGRAALEDGKIIGICDISAIALRIPHKTRPVGEELCELLGGLGAGKGILIFSPPGVGKTTLLRGMAVRLSTGAGARRVAVVDTRGELCFSLDLQRSLADVLVGYPRREGISIAVRTLGAQLIICDEIGDTDEASGIISAHNSGVPLLASAHAASVGELLRKPGIAMLHKSGCFGAYVGIKRRADVAFDYDYDVTRAEDADAFL